MEGLSQRSVTFRSEKSRGLTRLLLELREASPAVLWVHSQPRPPEGLPLSFEQEGLWSIEQLTPGRPVYHESVAFTIKGRLHMPALQWSFQQVIQRHEILRTSFKVQDGKPRQLPGQDFAPDFSPVDLRSLPREAQENALQSLLDEEAQRGFCLTQGPLLRVQLIRLGETETVFQLTLHPIIADGWSVRLLLGELGTCYQAFLDRSVPALLPLAIQYADYAAWQRQWLQGQNFTALVDYWKEQLAEVPGSLNLPGDHPRPSVQSYHGAHLTTSLPAAMAHALRRLACEQDMTLFMLLLASYNVLVYRYSGQPRFATGSVVANRGMAEVDRLIGNFANTLALRADFSGSPTFMDVLQQTRKICLEAYAHQALPFEKLVEALQAERQTNRHPVFQVMFNLLSASTTEFALPGLTIQQIPVALRTMKFDLALSVVEPAQLTPGQPLVCTWEYNGDLFEPQTIQRLASHWTHLLGAVLDDPGCSVDDLPLLAPAERGMMLVDWNATQADLPNVCLHELFENRAQAYADTPAVIFAPGELGQRRAPALTYRQLDAGANQVAHFLRLQWVGAESIVGLCLPHSTWLPLALLGVLKAGGAYLPLDPELPVERLGLILKDSRAGLVLTERRYAERFAGLPARLVFLDEERETIAAQPKSSPVNLCGPKNLAYVLYTSGSTGKPKGVLIPHRAVVNHSLAIRKAFELQPGDRVLQFAPLSFDVAVEEIFPTWLSGATLVIPQEKVLSAGQEFYRLVKQEKLNVLNLPASFWHEWVAQLGAAKLPPLASLRLLVVGSERVSPQSLLAWKQLRWDRARVLNAYGTTETTVTSLLYDTATFEGESGFSEVPVGRPVANTQAYILDQNGQPVPVGVVGELYLGGQGLGRGYLNDYDLTTTCFLMNPFVPQPGERMYRTGDLARYLPDGNILLCGRNDRQIKIGGFRIQMAEVETALKRQAAVSQAVVCPSPAGLLTAYVVLQAGQTASPQELHLSLRNSLPGYMLPSQYVFLDAIPLQVSGKTDYSRLAELGQNAARAAQPMVAARNPLEEVIAEVWADVLGLEDVGVYSSFIELGGHSLLVTQVISRLQKIFRREISPRILFEAPHIAGLAEHLLKEEPVPGSSLEIARLHRQIGQAGTGEAAVRWKRKELEISEVSYDD